MPELNGMELAGILRYAFPKIRIVLLTMFAEDFASNFTALFHIDAVVSKTNGLADLTMRVTSLLADQGLDTPFSPNQGTLQAPSRAILKRDRGKLCS